MNESVAADREFIDAFLAPLAGPAEQAVLAELSDQEAAILRSVLERLMEVASDVQAHTLGGLVW